VRVGGAVKKRNSAFAQWFRVRQCRIGQKEAIIAVAREILILLLQTGRMHDPVKQVTSLAEITPIPAYV